MSLEAVIAENTVALREVAALLTESNATRADALAKLAADGGDKAPAPGRKPKSKPADEAKASEPEAPKFPTIDALREAAVKFNGADGEEKARRKEVMQAIIDHLDIPANEAGKRQITAAKEEDREQIISWFEMAENGEVLPFMEAPAADEDDIG